MIQTVRRRRSPIASWLLVLLLLVQSAATAAMPLQMAVQSARAMTTEAAAAASSDMPTDMACCDEHEPMPSPAQPTAHCSCDCSLLTSIQLPPLPLLGGGIALPAIALPADVAAWALTRRESPPLRPPISVDA